MQPPPHRSGHRRVGVFCGPSLPPEDRIAGDGICYLPPAARGDLEGTATERTYDALLLIDGVFHYDLAPSPKECYRAAQVVRCFGAASIGALRAAECRPYGFVPLGTIARWYVRDRIDGDDEVAVLVDPRSQRALTVASVNVRHAARMAMRHGALAPLEARRWIDDARAIFYAERTWDAALALAPAHARAALAHIADRDGDLKRLDARFALRRVLRWLESSSLPLHA